jgi:hypothetical protein
VKVKSTRSAKPIITKSLEIKLPKRTVFIALSISETSCPFADAYSQKAENCRKHSCVTGTISGQLIHRYAIIVLYSGQKECGHRRQRLLMEFEVWPETAIRLNPTHTFPNVSEVALVALAGGPSSDESRRAAAALRYTTAMLTNEIHGASAPLHPYVLYQHR